MVQLVKLLVAKTDIPYWRTGLSPSYCTPNLDPCCYALEGSRGWRERVRECVCKHICVCMCKFNSGEKMTHV